MSTRGWLGAEPATFSGRVRTNLSGRPGRAARAGSPRGRGAGPGRSRCGKLPGCGSPSRPPAAAGPSPGRNGPPLSSPETPVPAMPGQGRERGVAACVVEDVFTIQSRNGLEKCDRPCPVGRRPDLVSLRLAHLPEPEEALREILSILGNVRVGTDQRLAQRHRVLAARPAPRPASRAGAERWRRSSGSSPDYPCSWERPGWLRRVSSRSPPHAKSNRMASPGLPLLSRSHPRSVRLSRHVGLKLRDAGIRRRPAFAG